MRQKRRSTAARLATLGARAAREIQAWLGQASGAAVRGRSSPGRLARPSLERLEVRQLLAVSAALVRDMNPNGASGEVSQVVEAGGLIFFAANNGATGQELWTTDGTSSGTQLVIDIRDGLAASAPYGFASVGGLLYFSADDGLHGRELWRSDGTSSGTVLVADVFLGVDSSLPRDLTNVGGTLYFTASDADGDRELWRSDGTSTGTSRVADIRPGPAGSQIDWITNLAGTLIFEADDGLSGRELWRSDGTSSGTFRLADLWPGTNGSEPGPFVASGNALYFSAVEPTTGRELWRTDGTSTGTLLVKDLIPGSTTSNPQELTDVDGTLFFISRSSDLNPAARDLWRSDGTSSGTTLVKHVDFGLTFQPGDLTNVSGTLFFTDAVQFGYDSLGYDLWRSNGSSAGTQRVKQFLPQSELGGVARYLTNVKGTLYFAADEVGNGIELWRSDGTSSGTTMAANIRPGTSSSNPLFLTNVQGSLYFVADDGMHGAELWVLRTDAPAPLIGDANGDGVVGAGDYAVWAATFGQVGAGLAADFDGNGSVGAGDYALWAANFGKTLGGSGTVAVGRVAAAEPSTPTPLPSTSRAPVPAAVSPAAKFESAWSQARAAHDRVLSDFHAGEPSLAFAAAPRTRPPVASQASLWDRSREKPPPTRQPPFRVGP